jgi:hypothetical protein
VVSGSPPTWATNLKAVARNAGIFCGTAILGHTMLGLASQDSTYAAGSYSDWYRTIAGTIPDQLTATEQSDLSGTLPACTGGLNIGNYQNVAGVPNTLMVQTMNAQWTDNVRGLDWANTTIQVNCLAVLQNNKKVGFTDASTGLFVTAIRGGMIKQGQDNGLIASTPVPTVVATPVAQQSVSNKNSRFFSGIQYTYTLTGAINALTVSGVVTV